MRRTVLRCQVIRKSLAIGCAMDDSGAEYDRGVTLRDYFEQRASSGSWGSLYDGAPDPTTYNFTTRRAAVAALLAADGAYPSVLDVGCGTGDYAEIAACHDGEALRL